MSFAPPMPRELVDCGVQWMGLGLGAVYGAIGLLGALPAHPDSSSTHALDIKRTRWAPEPWSANTSVSTSEILLCTGCRPAPASPARLGPGLSFAKWLR